MSATEAAIPVIDIASLVTGSRAGEIEIARRLGEACRNIGFFYITGHGVSHKTMQDVFDASTAFFASPEKNKEAVAFTGPGGNRGYIRLGEERLAPDKPADMKEAFNIGLELAPQDPDLLAGKPFRAANIWPDIPGFRAVMLDYFEKIWKLGVLLHRAFAIDLELDAEFFVDKFRKPMATLRLLHYPPVDRPLSSGQLGAGEHTDYGNVTLLATDAVGGLMVRDRSGRWLDAPVIPNAFVCNIGDCLMRWTNDVYVSTPHKVISPPGRDRYSIAFFLDPDPDAIVACLPTCVNSRQLPKYPSVTAADFLKSRLEPTYAHRRAS